MAARAIQEKRARLEKMTPKERKALEDLARAHGTEGQWEDVDGLELDNLLNGSERLEISNGGNELGDLIQEIYEAKIVHTRILGIVETVYFVELKLLIHKCTHWLTPIFNGVMIMIKGGPMAEMPSKVIILLRDNYQRNIVMHLGAEEVICTIKPNDSYIASALIRQGLVPCSPISPTTAITINALELYRTAHLRSPHFSIQAFVKTLCDLHGVTFQCVLSRQFSISFDLYLQIPSEVDKLVSQALHRDSADWRLKHACPVCMYTLDGEAALKFKLLYAMDGNDSLKRVIRCMPDLHEDDTTYRPSSELPTGQVVCSSIYLSHDYVNQFTDDVAGTKNTSTSSESKDENPCAGRWKNMDDQKTKKTWGIYDETGIFLAVCRHGMSLLIADMVQSGELAKYPLAVVNKLVETLGSDLGGGYDIGCQFSTTLDRSSIGPLIQSSHHTCLIGAFHGHAHRRLCQLSHLTLYTQGIGLEDLETCKRTFSKSNALSSTMCHSSIFHRQHSISNYFEYNDNYEVYANLSNFIYSNYKQALEILADGNSTLLDIMRDLNITNKSVFDTWRQEEKAYLESIHLTPLVVHGIKTSNTRGQGLQSRGKQTQDAPTKTAFCHAQEAYEEDLRSIQELEDQTRHPSTEYRRALDRLESLVVARIFELSKINRAGTGYKMQKHIAKALQTRSAAICTALDHYNAAARAMRPPHCVLKWDEVVEYAFLADFDLLRDTHQDVSQNPWATPAARYAMDLHYKMVRAEEEIQRLNIEAWRLLTYVIDEERYLQRCEELLKAKHSALAHQVALRRKIRGRCNMVHIQRLHDLSKLPRFSGTFTVGVSTQTSPGESASVPHVVIPPSLLSPTSLMTAQALPLSPDDQDSVEDLEEEEDAERDAEEASLTVENVIEIATDL
ncbi:hypothetical protein BU15DRAFT_81804 [Melanogaster broomeanus]|nr:hypothetical protein BU15DRAFT_81804 [Melanogaster broomeanus]